MENNKEEVYSFIGNYKTKDMNERDLNVCRMYKEGVNIVKIADENRISHSTIYRIIKDAGIPLRTEVSQKKQQEAIERICWYFDNNYSMKDIVEKTGISRRTIDGVLKRYREKELSKRLARIKREKQRKEQEEMIKKNRESKSNRVSHISGLLERQEKAALEWEEAEGYRPGMRGLQSIIDNITVKNDEDERNRLIAKDYAKGLKTDKILEKHNITQKHLYKLLEGDYGKEPGYFPDRPPLVD